MLHGFADQLEVLLDCLPRTFDRFTATASEEHAIEVSGGKLDQALSEFHCTRVGVGPDGEVGEFLHLLGGSVCEFFAAVTKLDSEQGGDAIEIALAAIIEEVLALTAHDDRNLAEAIFVDRMSGEMHPEVVLSAASHAIATG